MKSHHRLTRFPVRLTSLIVAGLFSGSASAAGFQLLEQNASGIGNSYAGSAAVAEDASTVFFNPAGMAFLARGKAHVALGLDLVKPSVRFSDSGTVMPAGISARGGNGGDAGDLAYIPDTYLVLPITDKLSVGLGLNAPFGLKTEYDSNWVGRFLAIKSEIKTVNLNPSISYKLTDGLALGFGVNYQYFKAELSNAVNFSAVIPGLEGLAKISGDDRAWGWNVGAMFQLSPATRLGLAYRSAIKYEVDGNVNFTRPVTGIAPADAALNAAAPNGAIRVNLKVPDNFTVSGIHQLNDRWQLLGDLSWTGWSKIPRLEVYRSSGALLSREELQWRDTYRVAVGANYQYDSNWKLRVGVAYDQSPVGDQYRAARLPDDNRTWLSLGAQYRLSKDAMIDVGYAYLWVDDSSTNNNGGSLAAKGRLQGNYNNDVNILGIQYSQSF